MSRRLYFGKLAPDTRRDELERLVEPYGAKVEVRVMTGFGFVEFESARDAEDAVRDLNGKTFLGSPIVVEFAKESSSRRNHESFDRDRGGFAPRRRPPGHRIVIDNLHRDTSWQDLKDFGREAGNVSFSDIDRDVPGRGVLEYISRDDAEYAVKTLDARELRGQVLRVTLGDERGGADNFRRDDRDRYRERDRYRDSRDRDDRYRDTRYRDDRYKDERPRRRSLSPARGSDRPRSPPRSKDYDDRRRGDEYDRGETRREDREHFSASRSNGDGANWSR